MQIGPFEVLRELGRGGMGAVYLCREPGAALPLAVKVIHSDLSADEDLAERFQREGEVLERLDHPHLVRLRGRGRLERGLWLAMDYVEGESLGQRLKRQGPLPSADARALLIPLCEALAHAHAAGVLHRDLKPDNVLLRASDGAALVVDFGLALPLDLSQHLTRTGEILGSPGYLAPEQCGLGQGSSAATDVYGLGALLYAALTGAPPLRGASLLQTLDLVLHQRPEPPSALTPGVDPGLEAICLRCLAKAPAERYPDTLELAEALRARAAPRPKRRPLALAGLVFAATAALALVLGRRFLQAPVAPSLAGATPEATARPEAGATPEASAAQIPALPPGQRQALERARSLLAAGQHEQAFAVAPAAPSDSALALGLETLGAARRARGGEAAWWGPALDQVRARAQALVLAAPAGPPRARARLLALQAQALAPAHLGEALATPALDALVSQVRELEAASRAPFAGDAAQGRPDLRPLLREAGLTLRLRRARVAWPEPEPALSRELLRLLDAQGEERDRLVEAEALAAQGSFPEAWAALDAYELALSSRPTPGPLAEAEFLRAVILGALQTGPHLRRTIYAAISADARASAALRFQAAWARARLLGEGGQARIASAILAELTLPPTLAPESRVRFGLDRAAFLAVLGVPSGEIREALPAGPEAELRPPEAANNNLIRALLRARSSAQRALAPPRLEQLDGAPLPPRQPWRSLRLQAEALARPDWLSVRLKRAAEVRDAAAFHEVWEAAREGLGPKFRLAAPHQARLQKLLDYARLGLRDARAHERTWRELSERGEWSKYLNLTLSLLPEATTPVERLALVDRSLEALYSRFSTAPMDPTWLDCAQRLSTLVRGTLERSVGARASEAAVEICAFATPEASFDPALPYRLRDLCARIERGIVVDPSREVLFQALLRGAALQQQLAGERDEKLARSFAHTARTWDQRSKRPEAALARLEALPRGQELVEGLRAFLASAPPAPLRVEASASLAGLAELSPARPALWTELFLDPAASAQVRRDVLTRQALELQAAGKPQAALATLARLQRWRAAFGRLPGSAALIEAQLRDSLKDRAGAVQALQRDAEPCLWERAAEGNSAFYLASLLPRDSPEGARALARALRATPTSTAWLLWSYWAEQCPPETERARRIDALWAALGYPLEPRARAKLLGQLEELEVPPLETLRAVDRLLEARGLGVERAGLLEALFKRFDRLRGRAELLGQLLRNQRWDPRPVEFSGEPADLELVSAHAALTRARLAYDSGSGEAGPLESALERFRAAGRAFSQAQADAWRLPLDELRALSALARAGSTAEGRARLDAAFQLAEAWEARGGDPYGLSLELFGPALTLSEHERALPLLERSLARLHPSLTWKESELRQTKATLLWELDRQEEALSEQELVLQRGSLPQDTLLKALSLKVTLLGEQLESAREGPETERLRGVLERTLRQGEAAVLGLPKVSAGRWHLTAGLALGRLPGDDAIRSLLSVAEGELGARGGDLGEEHGPMLRGLFLALQARVLRGRGDLAGARAAAKRGNELSPLLVEPVLELAACIAAGGQLQDARALLQDLARQPLLTPRGRGRVQRALERLEQR